MVGVRVGLGFGSVSGACGRWSAASLVMLQLPSFLLDLRFSRTRSRSEVLSRCSSLAFLRQQQKRQHRPAAEDEQGDAPGEEPEMEVREGAEFQALLLVALQRHDRLGEVSKRAERVRRRG